MKDIKKCFLALFGAMLAIALILLAASLFVIGKDLVGLEQYGVSGYDYDFISDELSFHEEMVLEKLLMSIALLTGSWTGMKVLTKEDKEFENDDESENNSENEEN